MAWWMGVGLGLSVMFVLNVIAAVGFWIQRGQLIQARLELDAAVMRAKAYRLLQEPEEEGHER